MTNRLAWVVLVLFSVFWQFLSTAAERPNIIVILADDLGYSDISPYGGEISTPNLDQLAREGLKFRNFYNTARCCPTRASLLTGLNPHEAGIGHMTSENERQHFDYGTPAYQGFLNKQCLTLAEALGQAGYRTLMSGKWHVGTFEGMWPRDRGFDRYYGLIRGASNFYKPGLEKMLTLDDEPVGTDLPDDYYTTTAFTDHAIEFVSEAVEEHGAQPFFLYLAYTSPHWPVQAPKKYVERYRMFYEKGWDALREKRYEGVVASGLISDGTVPAKSVAPEWRSLKPAKRKEMAHRMALYAGMIEAMDDNIGRLIEKLEVLGERDNTLIIFLSDNGGCAEGGMLGSDAAAELGSRYGYFLTLGKAWANYCNTPFHKYKHYTTEGGSRTPCIMNWPRGIKNQGTWSDQMGAIVDFMPTFLDLANAQYPESHNGEKLKPLAGSSLVQHLTHGTVKDRSLFFEHEGNKSHFKGQWKAVLTHDEGNWKLYHLADDPTEQNDLSGEQPDRLRQMIFSWDEWANSVGVRPWPVKRPDDYEISFRSFPVNLSENQKSE